MKKILIILVGIITLSSCGAKKFLSPIEPNVGFTDEGLNQKGIDTMSVVGAYVTIDKSFVSYSNPDFNQNENTQGGVVVQNNKLSGDRLVVPSRIFRFDKKGKKILDKNGNPVTDPAWYEITSVNKGTNSRYSAVNVSVESDSGSGQTFVFVPVYTGQRNQSYNRNPQKNRGIYVPDLGNTNMVQRINTSQNNSQTAPSSDVNYQLLVIKCDDCDRSKLSQSGILVDRNGFLYFNYEKIKYVATLTKTNEQVFVDARFASVQLGGIYFATENEDTRTQGVGKSKKIGQ